MTIKNEKLKYKNQKKREIVFFCEKGENVNFYVINYCLRKTVFIYLYPSVKIFMKNLSKETFKL